MSPNENFVAPDIGGFDVETIQLLFGTIVGIQNITYRVYTFLELYIAVKQGLCDIAVGGLDSGNLAALSCLPSCDMSFYNLSGFPASGDYSTSDAQALSSHVCCLQNTVPIMYSGFAIASMVNPDPLTVAKASFSGAALIDMTLILLIIIIGGAIGFWAVEMLPHTLPSVHRLLMSTSQRLAGAPAKQAPSAPRVRFTTKGHTLRHTADGIYWALTTLSTIGYGDMVPSGSVAKAFTCFFIIVCLAGLTVYSAVLSANITTTVLAQKGVQTLAQVTGKACLEENYDLLDNYLASSAVPFPMVTASLASCMDSLSAGHVQVVISSHAALSYYVANWAVPGTTVSPILQSSAGGFSIYLPTLTSQATLAAINTLILTAQQSPPWSLLYRAQEGRYSNVNAAGRSNLHAPYDDALVACICSLGGFAFLQTLGHKALSAWRSRRQVAAEELEAQSELASAECSSHVLDFASGS